MVLIKYYRHSVFHTALFILQHLQYLWENKLNTCKKNKPQIDWMAPGALKCLWKINLVESNLS